MGPSHNSKSEATEFRQFFALSWVCSIWPQLTIFLGHSTLVFQLCLYICKQLQLYFMRWVYLQ